MPRVLVAPQEVPGAAAKVAVGSLLVQVAIILGFVAFYVVELVRGEGDDSMRVAMSVVVFLLGAAGLLVLARGLWVGSEWPRTPTVLWNVLVLLLCPTMIEAGQPLLAVGVAALCLSGAGGTILAARDARNT
ncbi:hypothetical protein [Austwickia chelonae]|uniref:hypothetical protein n=1 Tax=Austwickia chelonae TaxID=100225 RepID=UPI00138AF541|nr:hypothetical protein [Austwickia chelonae]